MHIQEMTKQSYEEALRMTKGNRVQAAKLLGVERKKFSRMMKELGINPLNL